MRPSRTADAVASGLWYELGGLYAAAGESGRRARALGFTVVCVTAALVLLSAPLFGTSWAGPFAPAIPVLAGLLAGGGYFARRRLAFLGRRETLRRALAEEGLDADRPAAAGLGTYYDAQLILLRSEYEFLRSRGTRRGLRSARLFETSFGFAPEDGFECGPLNVAPDSREMRGMRERWEACLSARRVPGAAPPLGLREDAHYRVFPREMTVSAELATRSAYLEISCKLFRARYGKRGVPIPEHVRHRAERDLREYRALIR